MANQIPISVLGIYGHSAYANPPQQEVEFDVNQVPMMFYDYLPLVNGTVFTSMLIDGQQLKDHQLEVRQVWVQTDSNVVARRASDFWVPQKFRTPGRHTVTVRVGIYETYKVLGIFPSQRIVWVDSKSFGLTFTGIKAE